MAVLRALNNGHRLCLLKNDRCWVVQALQLLIRLDLYIESNDTGITEYKDMCECKVEINKGYKNQLLFMMRDMLLLARGCHTEANNAVLRECLSAYKDYVKGISNVDLGNITNHNRIVTKFKKTVRSGRCAVTVQYGVRRDA